MTDALVVIGCLVVGYLLGRLHAELKHRFAVENLGAHLLTLADFPHSDGRLREHLRILGNRLVGGDKP